MDKDENQKLSWKTLLATIAIIVSLLAGIINSYAISVKYIQKVATIQYVDAKLDKFYIELLTLAITQKQNRLSQIKILESLDQATPGDKAESENLKQSLKEFRIKREHIQNNLLQK